MKRTFRTGLATALLSVAMLVAFGPTGSAAGVSDSEPHWGVVLQAPAAPPFGSHPTTVRAPSIYPPVAVTVLNPGQSTPCYYGTLCTAVWNPVAGNYTVFRMYHCNTYALSYWYDSGSYADAQYGNVTSTFFDAYGRAITSFTSGSNPNYPWTPVYKIKNC